MSASSDIFILSPRSAAAYGQDFLDAHVRAASGFVTLHKKGGRYSFDLARAAAVVVGQNPDDEEESRFLNSIGTVKRTAVFVHCQWAYYNSDEKNRISRALETATIGITPSKLLSHDMKKLFPRVIWKSVDGCADEKFFYPSSKKERYAFRRNLGLSEDEFVVLFAGRLEAAKGTKILRDLCAITDRDFTILVQYPAWQEVRERPKLFQGYIDFCQELGSFSKVVLWPDRHPRISPRPVRFVDLFLSPSLSEAQPLVLLEALACGVPFVGTNSTPEYGALRQRFRANPTLSNAIRMVELPDYLQQGAIARSSDLRDSDSRSIAASLGRMIAACAVPDDASRTDLSEAFLAQGFTVPDREASFRQALEDMSLENAS